MTMVVEGVEDAATLASLRQWGCDIAQGYHLARPMPARRFLDWLAARPAASSAVVPVPRRPLDTSADQRS
jgi:EAL domain-containing protein (putative c-di-GMP-specific phosphodiesterase class I)